MISLHIHSNFSDGTYSFKQIAEKATKEKCELLSICDHDGINIDGYKLLEKSGLNVIQGVEITMEGLSNFHMLGYGIKKPHYINVICEKVKKYNNKACEKIIYLLQQQGIDISAKAIYKMFGKSYIDKTLIKNYLVEKNYAKDNFDAYQSFIGKDTLNYVPIRDLDAKFVINLIKVCGGVPVIAHPMKIIDKVTKKVFTIDQTMKLIDKLCEYGLVGVEVFNGKAENYKLDVLKEFCNDRGLVILEGSDYHNEKHSFSTLGDVFDRQRFNQALKESEANYSIDKVRNFHSKCVKPFIDKSTNSFFDELFEENDRFAEL